jgi:hypothetical protein
MNKKLNFARPVFLIAVFALGFGLQLQAQDKVIPQEELPQKATEFIQTHFADQKVLQVTKDVDFLIKTEYEILLNDGFQLEFNSKGDWKDVDGNNKVIPTGFVPESLMNYIADNFPTEQVTGISKQSSGYELELTNRLELEFDSNGAFKRIDD